MTQFILHPLSPFAAAEFPNSAAAIYASLQLALSQGGKNSFSG